MTQESSQEVRVFAPATVANVACGFDVLGFAIEAPGDEVVARHSDKPGLRITKITGDNGKLPKDVEKNTAGVAALDFLRHLGSRQVVHIPQVEQPTRLWRQSLKTGFQCFATVTLTVSLSGNGVSESTEQFVREDNPCAILSPIEIDHPRLGDPQRPPHKRPTRFILVKTTCQLLSDPLNDVFSIVKSGD